MPMIRVGLLMPTSLKREFDATKPNVNKAETADVEKLWSIQLNRILTSLVQERRLALPLGMQVNRDD